MEELKEKEISSKKIFEGKLLKLRIDAVEMPSGKKAEREIVEHPGAVAVVALTKEKEIILVRQFRKAANEVLLEIPAGVPLPGEKPEETARRELEEETGYHAKKVRKLWEGYASPGYSTEVIQFFLAEEMTLLKQRPDEDEKIEVDLVEIELAEDLVKSGKVRDNKTAIGILLASSLVKGQ